MTDFSYQLYSSRNFPPLADTLSMLARLGYTSVEGYGALYADAQKVSELQAILGDSGLTMPTGHFSLEMIESEPERVVEIARSLGVRTVYCPAIKPEARPDSGVAWNEFGKRLQEAGNPLRDAGLGFGWHNHAFEFEICGDGATPMGEILAGGPDLEWEADIAWLVKGGADPMHWIAEHGDRITAVHIKDIAREGENADEDGWADVGHGTLDWATLMEAARGTKAKYFVVEHDNPSDAARFAERSLATAKKL
jgi:sugar phosphate isomerase/epimerase